MWVQITEIQIQTMWSKDWHKDKENVLLNLYHVDETIEETASIKWSSVKPTPA
jgi:hypothetical protein